MNNKYILLIFTLLCLSNLACNPHPVFNVIELNISKETIPEGIAIDPSTSNIYISSLYLHQIVKTDSNGNFMEVVIEPFEHGYSKGTGMQISKDKLFALGTMHQQTYSILLIKNLKAPFEVQSYALPIEDNAYFNDLALDSSLNAYITDTRNHVVYKFDYAEKSFDSFFKNEQLKYPNGICISDDNRFLYVDSYTHGIRIVDLQNRRLLNDKHESSSNIGIDGLKYYNNSLYAITNGAQELSKHGLIKLNLIDDGNKIEEREDILINHPLMNIPTTLSLANKQLYILANSQLENLNQEVDTIFTKSALTYTFVIRHDLSH